MIRDDYNACYDCFWQVFVAPNMVIWKERQHDNEDAFTERNVGYIATLRNCGLLKFFQTPSMVSHERLLEYILRMWNLEQQYFEVGAYIMTVEVEDIYFLRGLSQWGAPISLTGSHGGEINTQGLIDIYCFLGTQTCKNKIPIKVVMDLSLRTELLTMQCILGIQGAH